MDTEKIRQGATFEITFTDSDTSANTVTMTVSDDSGIVAQSTVNYSTVNNKRVATILLDTSSLAVKEYQYMYTIVYDNKTVKLPDPDQCDGECTLPKFIVCAANDIE